MGVSLLLHVSNMYSLEDINLVKNLATRACDGTVVYPSVYQGVLGGILSDFVSYPVSLKWIVKKIWSEFQIWPPGLVVAL